MFPPRALRKTLYLFVLTNNFIKSRASSSTQMNSFDAILFQALIITNFPEKLKA